MRKRIYIAGPMTGLPNFNREAFFEAADQIANTTDLLPIHTAWARDGLDYDEYMELSFDLIAICDILCVLPGWKDSQGAKEEVAYASYARIPVVELECVEKEFGRKDSE